MKKIITNNLGLKLASVVLACMLWFLVAELGNPRDTKYYSNIPVRLVNTVLLEEENKVYEILDNTDTVRVAVKAPRSVIDNLRASDIVAEADMSKLTDINTIAISYSLPNVEYNSITGDHDVVRLNVEDKATKWIPLRCNTTGEVEEGYIVYSTTSDQTQVEVSGPKSIVDQINYAGVDINVEGASTNMSANMNYNLYTSEGNRINQQRISKNVNQVKVSVEVLATKEVPVVISSMGTPAEGFMATGEKETNINTIVLAGTNNALANISKLSIPAEELDITDATDTVFKSLDLKKYLPDNIKIAQGPAGNRLKVTIYIEPIEERVITVLPQNISLQRVPEGVEARVLDPEQEYTLLVSGLSDRIDSLVAAGIFGSIDLTAYMEEHGLTQLHPGVYELPVKFSFVNSVTVEEQLIVKVEVASKE